MKPKRSLAILSSAAVLLAASLISAAQMGSPAPGDGKWLHRVPDEDRARTNPFAQPASAREAAVAAGKRLYAENCFRCHGAEAAGRRNRPSLRSERVRHATDGELAWMLEHGNPYQGMPPWNALPESQRWQIIAYLRSLPPLPQSPPGPPLPPGN